MAPLGFKPNSPDYGLRNWTSSKWDLNPYELFIMQQHARWEQGREGGTAQSPGPHSPAVMGTGLPQGWTPGRWPLPAATQGFSLHYLFISKI